MRTLAAALGLSLGVLGCTSSSHLADPPPAASTSPATAHRYLAHGDSFTIGTGTTPDRAFPARLVARCGAAVELRNVAVNGYSTEDILEREMPEVARFAPTFVTLAAGANDIVRGSSPGEYRTRVRTILSALKAAGVARIVTLPQPDWSQSPAALSASGSPAEIHARIVEAGGILREETAAVGGAYVDMFPLMESQAHAGMIARDGPPSLRRGLRRVGRRSRRARPRPVRVTSSHRACNNRPPSVSEAHLGWRKSVPRSQNARRHASTHPLLRLGSVLFAIAAFSPPAACGGSTADSSHGADAGHAGEGGGSGSGSGTSSGGTTSGGGNEGGVTSESGAAGDDASSLPTATPIKHVVVIVKENATPSTTTPGSFPGAEGTTTCLTSTGAIPVPHAPNSTSRDLCHEHSCALTDWDGGKLDGWLAVSGASTNGDNLFCAQYQEADIPNYWAYAKNFALGDHFFANVLGPSFPGHTFFLAAQAGWATGNPGYTVTSPYWGCDESSTYTVPVDDQTSCTSKSVAPCFSIPSVPTLLPTGTDWKFYGTNFYVLPEIWSMFDAISTHPQRPPLGQRGQRLHLRQRRPGGQAPRRDVARRPGPQRRAPERGRRLPG